MARVTIVDYGMGNLFSVVRAFEHVGAQVDTASDPRAVENAQLLVLPGVGAFSDGMQGLAERRLVEPIREHAAGGRPLIGICLGLHMLMEGSSEFGHHAGLGLVPGEAKPLPGGGTDKIPNVGWAPIQPGGVDWSDSAFAELSSGTYMYFCHSYAVEPEEHEDSLAETRFNGSTVCAAVSRGNVSGTQFHPERSGPAGLSILRNLVRGLETAPSIDAAPVG